MNKSILIIDTPKNCAECRIRLSGEPNEWCWYLRHGLDDIKTKPSWCPLKPMPQKKNCIVYQGEVNVDIPIDFLEKIHNQGYNDCLDEILGETE